MRRERKIDKRSTGFETPDISLSLSLSPRTLADFAEEAGTMVTDRECLSKGKKRKYQNLPTVANVNLIVLAQEGVEPEMQVKTPTKTPSFRRKSNTFKRSFSWVMVTAESPYSPCYQGVGRLVRSVAFLLG